MLLNLLLAEKDADDLYLLTEIIKSTNLPIEVNHIHYCDEVFEKIKTLMMPDILIVDGFHIHRILQDCIKAIRADERLKEMPLIVLSGRNNERVKEELYAIGIDKYFIKPSCIEEYVEIIKVIYSTNWVGERYVHASVA